ncbi:MAG: leucyl aminopeptidase family protein [Alphaproteobacteria bacterium]
MNPSYTDDKSICADLLVVPVFDGCELGEEARKLDAHFGGLLSARMKNKEEFKAKFAQPLRLTVDPAFGTQEVLLLGMGKPENLNEEQVRKLGGAIMTAVKNVGARSIDFAVDSVEAMSISKEKLAAELADSLVERSYRFDKYKTTKASNDNPDLKASFIVDDPQIAQVLHARLHNITSSKALAKDYGNEPANILTPVAYAKRIETEFFNQPNVKTKTLDMEDMAALGMGGVLAVSQGSTRNPARIVVIEYDGTNGEQDRPFGLVGKGVTFDTGGYNLKPGGSMADMKTDMCGSAAVVGAMCALVLNKEPVKVVAIVGLAENMIDGHSYRPSDIITMMKGVTVEVGNTDAEGRLILADCMTYLQREYDPVALADIATLTGAMVVALGNTHTGIFSNDDGFRALVEEAGKRSGELAWPMPLCEQHTSAVKGKLADLSNTGSMNGAGASTAAAFLQEFVEPNKDGSVRPWVHLDIAGTSRQDGQVSGVGVRMLRELVATYEAKDNTALKPVLSNDNGPDAAPTAAQEA